MGARHVVPRRRLSPIFLLLPLITTCLADPEPLAVNHHSGSLQSHFVANLLSDPGFEAGGQDWQNASAPGRAVDNLHIHGGAAAERITASASQEFAVFQERSVIAESSYTASGWITTEGLNGAHAVLEVLWLTGSGLGDSIPPAARLGSDLVGALGSTTGWTFFTRSVTVPFGATVARFQLRLERELDNVGTAWFDDDTLSGPQALDETPPTVAITSPQAGSTIGGVVTITATATDAGPVAGVQFGVNGVNLGSEVTSPPYQIDLDTHTLPNGPADLTAAARDTAGNNTSFRSRPSHGVQSASAPDGYRAHPDRRSAGQYDGADASDHEPDRQSGGAVRQRLSPTPLCCPARATILTGLYPTTTMSDRMLPPYGRRLSPMVLPSPPGFRPRATGQH